jgi:butyrate kinase
MAEMKNKTDEGLILTINPRDLNTKVAVYKMANILFMKRVKHDTEELAKFKKVCDQTQYRKDRIMKELSDNDIPPTAIRYIFGRGGLCKPVKAGIYEVNDKLRQDLGCGEYGVDVLNLGGLIAYAMAQDIPGAKAYVADPVVVDEFDEISRISGHPLIERKSIFHALNQKYVAHKHAKMIGIPYEELNLIVISLGRAISVGAHKEGRVIDATQGYDGDGPFSPICSGTLPIGDVVRLCFSGKYTQEEMQKIIRGEGGMKAYLGTNSGYEVEHRIENGDEHARFIMEAMAYQVAQSAGAMCMAFKEKPDAILITGNLANSKTLVDNIVERVSKIAQVHIYPGDDELEALAMNAIRLIRGQETPLEYQ